VYAPASAAAAAARFISVITPAIVFRVGKYYSTIAMAGVCVCAPACANIDYIYFPQEYGK